jgi:hypothetical protein
MDSQVRIPDFWLFGVAVSLMALALTACGRPQTVGDGLGSPASTISETSLHSPDRRLSFSVPTGWTQLPCPVSGDEQCIQAVPTKAETGVFINGSFTGMNAVEGSPVVMYCWQYVPGLPTVPIITQGPPGGPSLPAVEAITVAGHHAFKISYPPDLDRNSATDVDVVVCLPQGNQSTAAAWLICRLGSHPDDALREACGRAIETFVASPDPEWAKQGVSTPRASPSR